MASLAFSRPRSGIESGWHLSWPGKRKELGERFNQLTGLGLVVGHPKAREDGLVELSFDRRRSTQVEAVGVGAEQENFVDCPAGLCDLDRVLFDDLPGVGDLPVDALLLSLEQVERYGIGVAGLDELLLLVSQLRNAPLLPFEFTLLPGLAAVQLYVDQLTDGTDARKVELDMPPLFLHLRLHVGDEHRPLVAGLGA